MKKSVSLSSVLTPFFLVYIYIVLCPARYRSCWHDIVTIYGFQQKNQSYAKDYVKEGKVANRLK